MEETKSVDLIKYYEYRYFIDTCRGKKYPADLVLHKHHIIPRHLGGLDSNENIILLSVDDHAIAHAMLSECFDPGSYENISNIRSANILDNLSIRDRVELDNFYNSYRGRNNPFYGRKHTSESIDKIRKNSGGNTRGLNYSIIYGSSEADQKINRSRSAKNQWSLMTEEERKRMGSKISRSLSSGGNLKGSKNPASYPLLVDGVFYPSVREALDFFGYGYYKKLHTNHNIIKLIRIK